jgi:uncharacterized repeat protein (TIGR02543 family)
MFTKWKARLGVLLALVFFVLLGNMAQAASILSVEMSPPLDISRFAPYRILATFDGTPLSSEVQITGINGDISGGTMYWNYKVDGTPVSDSRTKTLSYDSIIGKWKSQSIYPDDIYPEIYFADNDVTWYNIPSNSTTWRRNYHVLKIANPFSMTANMSVFLEINAAPNSLTNSGDLQVYLVGSGQNIGTYFNSDWRNKPQTQLVGTIAKTAAYHHQHTANATHHLIALTTNANGTIGANNIDISNDFYLVLYDDSTNSTRGWNLRYHNTSLCDNTANWYVADRSGGNTWNTPVHQPGCPDSHVHVARRDATIRDGVKSVLTANFGGGNILTGTQNFYFNDLPNLAPNPTSFISPLPGGIYDGGMTSIINVSWNPATDPNNDPLVYSVYLLDNADQVIDTLVSNITGTSFDWDISAVPNGVYKLKGVVTEDKSSPLSTDFFMTGTFTINKVDPIYSLSAISISADNPNVPYAKIGNSVTLSFTATGVLSGLTVDFYSGGVAVNDTPVLTNVIGNDWTAVYAILGIDTNGPVSFDIQADNLDQIYSVTTDETYVEVDVQAPSDTQSSPVPGIYDEPQSVTLNSTGASSIRYTLDGSDPTCSSGTLYGGAISITEPTDVRAIACDLAGNNSAVVSLYYDFQYTVTFDGNGGSGHVPTSRLASHGGTVVLPSDLSQTGYAFVGWNTAADGSGDLFDGTTVVLENMTVYAQWLINSYILTYDGNGNDGGDPYASENYTHGQTVTVKNQNTLSLTGYVFYGWNTESDGSGVSYQADDTFVITGDVNLYAQWLSILNCSAVFDGNGGSGHSPAVQTVVCDNSLNDEGKSLPSDPSRVGYAFSSWNIVPNGSGDTFLVTTPISVNPTNVYAQWTANSYTLNFDAQGGTVDPLFKSVVYNSAIGELPVTSKSGYTFLSWNTATDGSGVTYTADTVYQVAGNVTLYAQYQANTYRVIFNAQENGSVAISGKDVVYMTALGELPIATKSGYSFTEWNSMPDGSGISYDESTIYIWVADSGLFAQYAPNNYLLSFNTAGGSTVNSKTVTYGSPVGALDVPTKSSYVFDGWYSEPYGEGTQYTDATLYEIAGGYLLFANWIGDEYTLSYIAGIGGSLTGLTLQTIQNGADGSEVVAVPNIGYLFGAWSDGVLTAARRETNVTANLIMTASFVGDTYTLTYTAGAGGTLSGNQNQTVNSGGNGSAVTAQANSGYRFVNWSDGSVANPRTDLNVLANLAVTANFRANGGTTTFFAPPVVTGNPVVPGTELGASNGAAGVVSGVNTDLAGSDIKVCPSVLFIRELRYGMQGTDVKALQKFLNDSGYLLASSGSGAPGEETIYFVNLTEGAVRRFQQAKGLPVTGIFDLSMRKYLGCVVSESAAKYQFTRNLQVGMTGTDVKELQKYLNAQGFLLANSGPGAPGAETEMFGSLTRQALIRFQLSKGISPAVGYFGPITRAFVNRQ